MRYIYIWYSNHEYALIYDASYHHIFAIFSGDASDLCQPEKLTLTLCMYIVSPKGRF